MLLRLQMMLRLQVRLRLRVRVRLRLQVQRRLPVDHRGSPAVCVRARWSHPGGRIVNGSWCHSSRRDALTRRVEWLIVQARQQSSELILSLCVSQVGSSPICRITERPRHRDRGAAKSLRSLPGTRGTASTAGVL